MKEIILEVQDEKFLIRFEEFEYPNRYSCYCYPITEGENISTKEKIIYFNSKTEGGLFYNVNDISLTEDECNDIRILFTCTFVSKGFWEGRIYFPDDEYWGEELSQMNEIFEKIKEHLNINE